MIRHSNFVIGIFLLSLPAFASSPTLTGITPRGGQRGTDVSITFRGDNLKDAQEVLFHDAGLTADHLGVSKEGVVTATLHIAADAPLGEHLLRIRCASGISWVQSFWVGPFPRIEEKEPNSDFEQPQKIAMNVTVEGRVTAEDVDYFVIDAKKGQRLSAEIEGTRLGGSFFDPYIAILDARRFELAACDDSTLLLQDGFVSILEPEDGPYVVMVREASYGGSDGAHYRLHVGSFPRPSAVYPPGGQKGTDLAVRFVGVTGDAATQTIHLPSEPRDRLGIFCKQGDLQSPSPNWLRVSNLANVLEVEPNNKREQATPVSDTATMAINGIIEKEGDEDWFRFTAKKDQKFDIVVFARALRSPLDSVVAIAGTDGKRIGRDDDGNGVDSKLAFKAPADGDYFLNIHDQLHGGGPDYIYRIEFLDAKPHLGLTLPQVAQYDSQSRQMIAVPKGGRYATLVNIARTNFGGDVLLAAPDLPPGITMHVERVPDFLSSVPVVFEAAPDAALGSRMVDWIVRGAADDKKQIQGRFTQAIEFTRVSDRLFYSSKADRLCAGVVEAVPYSIDIVPPKAPLVRNGAMNLKVTVARKEGFTEPVTVRMVWNPPGVGSQAAVTIPPDKTECDYPLSADDKARPQTWKIAMSAEAKHNGTAFVGSKLTDLTVAEPYVTAKIDLAVIEQGKPGQILVNIEHPKPFDGEATIKLLGLPNDVVTQEKKITKDTAQVIFPITSTDKSPIGQHKQLLCQVTVMVSGEPVVHSVGQGGVLRIDKPAPPAEKKEEPKPVTKPEEKKPEPTAAATKPPEKPLSRLEKLRLEAQEQKK